MCVTCVAYVCRYDCIPISNNVYATYELIYQEMPFGAEKGFYNQRECLNPLTRGIAPVTIKPISSSDVIYVENLVPFCKLCEGKVLFKCLLTYAFLDVSKSYIH